MPSTPGTEAHPIHGAGREGSTGRGHRLSQVTETRQGPRPLPHTANAPQLPRSGLCPRSMRPRCGHCSTIQGSTPQGSRHPNPPPSAPQLGTAGHTSNRGGHLRRAAAGLQCGTSGSRPRTPATGSPGRVSQPGGCTHHRPHHPEHRRPRAGATAPESSFSNLSSSVGQFCISNNVLGALEFPF